MNLGFAKVLDSLEKYSPALARRLAIKYLDMASPFNGHLKAKLKVWTPKKTLILIEAHRKIKNHLGGVHAGALFTLGETCAGLMLLKSFDLGKYRLILKTVTVDYSKQARGKCHGTCEISSGELKKLQINLKAAEAFLINLETNITSEVGDLLCVAKTQWQIKPWSLVKKS